MRNLVIYGGSFDPVHYGHIQTALAVQRTFAFERFVFLPCKLHALKKQAHATDAERLDMLRLATRLYPNLGVDDREIRRAGWSYTYDTLQTYRHELGTAVPITLLIGWDVFLQLPLWHRWEELFDLANLLIIARPHAPKETIKPALLVHLHQREIADKKQFLQHTCGALFRLNAGHYPVSSQALRQAIRDGQYQQLQDLPDVARYIQTHRLYQN